MNILPWYNQVGVRNGLLSLLSPESLIKDGPGSAPVCVSCSVRTDMSSGPRATMDQYEPQGLDTTIRRSPCFRKGTEGFIRKGGASYLFNDP